MKPSLRICHLYPELLNLYGDRGNVLILTHRALWRGIDVKVDQVSLGEHFDPDAYDLIFLGGGSDQSQAVVAEDFRQKGVLLKQAVESGKVLLTICGGYQLLGEYYCTRSGKEIPGVGVFHAYTTTGTKRLRGNIAIKMPGLPGQWPVIGYENHSGRTYLTDPDAAAGQVVFGFGNNGEDGTEGCRTNNAFGTYLHGPLLAKNPNLADYLLSLAIEQHYGQPFSLQPLDDSLELAANRAAFERFGKGASHSPAV